jgi:hypothetical protein
VNVSRAAQMRRWLLALSLVAGCGGPGGHAPAPDGGRDADAGGGDVAAAETHPDASDARKDVPSDVGDGGDQRATDAPDAGDAQDAIAETGVDGPPDVLQGACPATIPDLTLASGTVAGVLQGPSTNPAVSCHGGVPTGGPEAYFTLTITEEATVDLTVTSPIDTLIAIRPGPCSDTISELACGEDPPPPDGDAGAPPAPANDAGAAHVTGVRAPLSPGTYTIVVDSYTLGNRPSAAFTLKVAQVEQLPNAQCSMPVLLTAGTALTAQPLDRAGAPRSVCGTGTQSSLYYSVGVPSGQRLTVRATPPQGATWMPRLEAFSSCTSNTCLSQGRQVSGSVQQLDWINNSAAWELVFIAVGADSPVTGATFDIVANVVDLLATCARPMPVKDGSLLPGQDLSTAPTPASATCVGSTDHAFYYSASLLPQQTINVQATPSGTNGFATPNITIRQSCDSLNCNTNGATASFTNQSTGDATVLIEVAAFMSSVVGPFDLSVSIPRPPVGFVVTPESGLVTTESGGTATFTVVLTSPPTANVTIPVASDTPTEGTASPASLTFTAANWRTPQTVTVTGVDDQVSDGAQAYTIVLSPATSTDSEYNGLDPDDVLATNLDNDPGVSFTGALDVVTSEAGMKSTFGVVLNAAPTATVTMPLSSNDPGEGTVSPTQLTFTTSNWNTPQTVTVTGVDDAIVDGTQTYSIVTGPLSSADSRYNGQNPPDVTAYNLDDDQMAVALKVVSGDHACSTPSSTAVDRANQIYIVVTCENELWLTTSTDAGVTFTDLTSIPGSEIAGSAVQIVGGAPGFLYLLMAGNDGFIYFLRTADGGLTWSTRVMLSTRQDFMHLAAAGRTVLVATPGPSGSTQSALARSTDGGKSFLSKSLVDGLNIDVGIEVDEQTGWMIADSNGTVELRKSIDDGATFTMTGTINQDTGSVHLFGLTKVFTFLNGTLQVVDLADPTKVASSANFFSIPPFAMAGDDIDTLSVLDSDPNNHLRATRVLLGAPPPTSGRSLGPSPGAAGIATLSRKAAAVAVLNGNLVLYTTVVW